MTELSVSWVARTLVAVKSVVGSVVSRIMAALTNGPGLFGPTDFVVITLFQISLSIVYWLRLTPWGGTGWEYGSMNF